MKIRRVIRFISLYFALMLFLFDIYTAGYIRARGYSSPPPELLMLSCMVTFLMGVMILIAGLLTEKDESKERQRRVMILLGLFLAIGSGIGFLFVLPMLPPSGA